MTEDNRIGVTAEFRDLFDIVAKHYEMEDAGDMDEFRNVTRQRLKDDINGTMEDFRNMAANIKFFAVVSEEPKGVISSGNGFEFCVEKDDRRKTHRKDSGLPPGQLRRSGASESEPGLCGRIPEDAESNDYEGAR